MHNLGINEITILTYIYIAKFSFLRIVQTGSGAHPACCSMGTVALSLGVKLQGREAVHSPIRLHGVVLN
jgi:hypothetical protein